MKLTIETCRRALGRHVTVLDGTSSGNGKTSGRGQKGQKLVAEAVYVLVL